MLVASDEATNEKTAKKQASEPAEEQKTKERSLLEKLGDQLLGGNEAEDAQEAENENNMKIDRAVKGMRDAGEKLDEGRTAEETQKIQKQVIKDLDDIINQLENPPPSQGGGGGGGGGGESGGGGGGRSGASGRNRRSGGGASLRISRPQGREGRGTASGKNRKNSAKTDNKTAEQASENASDSSMDSPAARKVAEEAARRRKLDMDVWGHLPPHVREELLNTYGDRMLPKYEQMVKQFYEALSTQGESKKK
jgi:hypothetical protein